MAPPAHAAPMRRLPLLAALALALLAAPAGAAKPPKGLSAVPKTKVTSLRVSASGVAQAWSNQPVKTSYESYLTTMRKPPTSLSSTAKQATFKANLQAIVARNNNTKIKWTAAANHFTDLNVTERVRFLGIKNKKKGRKNLAAMLHRTVQSLAQIAAEAAPPVAAAALSASALLDGVPEWDVALPEVKNQGNCGCCWAFASTSITEAGHYIKTGEVLALSEKQLVDCNYPDNSGCDGGWYDQAFTYIIANGQATADSYPFVAQRDSCPASLPAPASKLASYKALDSGNEDAMLAALKDGPIAVAVNADDAWFAYAGGVYTSDVCSSVGADGTPDVNHAVVIVGAGVDADSQTPYWLVRNSWGTNWGEGGYIRIQRGSGSGSMGMCNIAYAPYQAVSADSTTAPPPPPPPVAGCQTATIKVTAKTSLADVAKQYNTSISQIMIDNKLSWKTLLTDGQQLTINCPTGTWSQPYGVWNNWNAGNAMSEIPTVNVCPPGAYAVSFYVKPSQWYNGAANFTGSTWVGTITMTCSDGTILTLDAQPGFNPGWADGNQTQITGFLNVTLSSGRAVDSLFGVGVISGEENGTFICPNDTLVTGFSGGASTSIRVGGTDSYYPKGWVNNLQFLCQNPYGVGFFPAAKVQAVRKVAPRFPRMRAGLSCVAKLVKTNDTWVSIANREKVVLTELLRSNPAINGTALPAGKRVFIPPCVDGVVYGTRTNGTKPKSSGPMAAAAAAADDVYISAPEAGMTSAAAVVLPTVAPGTWA